LVIFLYNSFGPELTGRVVATIEQALATQPRSIFLVACNPVHGDCMDASPCLKRYFAAMLPYAAEERGFGPDCTEAVVIWQGGTSVPPKPNGDLRIVVARDSRAELAG
jgi:hypothetical protein